MNRPGRPKVTLRTRFDACKHGLVPEGTVCPECVWTAASFGTRGADETRIRRQLIEIMLCACEEMLLANLRPEVRERAQDGNWYALQFVNQWHRERQKGAFLVRNSQRG